MFFFLFLAVNCSQSVEEQSNLVNPVDHPKEQSPNPLIALSKNVVQKQLQMPDDIAESLTVKVMGNGYIVGLKDPTSGLCFAVSETPDGWIVQHTGMVLPGDWTPSHYGNTMGHLVDIDNTRIWFSENCSTQ